MSEYTLRHGDALEVLLELEENSVDTCITDPPSGINFMGKAWDNHSKYEPVTERGQAIYAALSPLLAAWEVGFITFTADWGSMVYRVLKPGALALVWGLPRTVDLTVMGLRVAGFEIRDTIAHLFGSGFPKSLDISKAIDREAGEERQVVAVNPTYRKMQKEASAYNLKRNENITAPATPAVQTWQGFGTALKPAREDWVIAMKPIEGTYAENALKWGVAGLNIDAGRVGTRENSPQTMGTKTTSNTYGKINVEGGKEYSQGRWPANLILSHTAACQLVGTRETDGYIINRFTDGAKPFGNGAGHEYESEQTAPETVEVWECVEACPVRMLDEQSGTLQSGGKAGKEYEYPDYEGGNTYFQNNKKSSPMISDSGGASRFFYTAKPAQTERNFGLSKSERNHHVTVKPLELMTYLCKLTRPSGGGVVLDPFAGSGTTGMACIVTGRGFIGIERERDYYELAEKRLHAPIQPELLP